MDFDDFQEDYDLNVSLSPTYHSPKFYPKEETPEKQYHHTPGDIIGIVFKEEGTQCKSVGSALTPSQMKMI